jgi:hypothetical protein
VNWMQVPGADVSPHPEPVQSESAKLAYRYDPMLSVRERCNQRAHRRWAVLVAISAT